MAGQAPVFAPTKRADVAHAPSRKQELKKANSRSQNDARGYYLHNFENRPRDPAVILV
jgi:hypothetical protein